jgi:hypothetical protein
VTPGERTCRRPGASGGALLQPLAVDHPLLGSRERPLGLRRDALDDLDQAIGAQRLAHIVVHAGREVPLAVAAQRVRGQRHDREADAAGPLAGAKGGRGLEPVHVRHLDVHQHDVDLRVAGARNGLMTVRSQHDAMAAPFTIAVARR